MLRRLLKSSAIKKYVMIGSFCLFRAVYDLIRSCLLSLFSIPLLDDSFMRIAFHLIIPISLAFPIWNMTLNFPGIDVAYCALLSTLDAYICINYISRFIEINGSLKSLILFIAGSSGFIIGQLMKPNRKAEKGNRRIIMNVISGTMTHTAQFIYFGNCSNKMELKRRYHQLCRKLHPDCPGGKAKSFRRMQQEYEELSHIMAGY